MKEGFSLKSSSLLQNLKGFLRRETALYQDAESFNQLYEESKAQVFRYLYSFIGGHQQDAEDLMAETFLRAWRSRESYKGNEQTAIYWLLRIARNLAIDAYRRKAPAISEGIEPDYLADSANISAEAQLERADTRDMLNQLLQNLTPEAREAIILRYSLHWPIKQISAYLGKPESSISVMIHRSLRRLQSDWSTRKENENESK